MAIPLWVILGPTAVGKSHVAVELASMIDGEILVADSMQVYRGMDIGTAKLTDKEKIASNGLKIPHHLVDVVSPHETFSVAEYQKLAHRAIEDISGRGKIPLLAGGTALYLRAVTEPQYNFPPLAVDPALRQRLRRQAVEVGGEYLHQQLGRIDPSTAERLHPHDVRRVIRALEVYYLTGQPISAWRSRLYRDQKYDLHFFGLQLPRPLLYHRIDQRVETMLAMGWVEEVLGLLNSGLAPQSPSVQGLGYRQIAAYLTGKCSFTEMKRLIQRDTRHFAKRQLTWFRAEGRIQWLGVNEYDDATAVAREIANRGGRTKGLGVE